MLFLWYVMNVEVQQQMLDLGGGWRRIAADEPRMMLESCCAGAGSFMPANEENKKHGWVSSSG